MKRILFACKHNSGRSQMAEGFAKFLSLDGFSFQSAGTNPSETVNPLVVLAMKEKGIDILDNKPKLLTDSMLSSVDMVITMGCSVDQVYDISSVISEDWKLEDPAGQTIEKIRIIRDQIEDKINETIQGNGNE